MDTNLKTMDIYLNDYTSAIKKKPLSILTHFELNGDLACCFKVKYDDLWL